MVAVIFHDVLPTEITGTSKFKAFTSYMVISGTAHQSMVPEHQGSINIYYCLFMQIAFRKMGKSRYSGTNFVLVHKFRLSTLFL